MEGMRTYNTFIWNCYNRKQWPTLSMVNTLTLAVIFGLDICTLQLCLFHYFDTYCSLVETNPQPNDRNKPTA